MKASACDGDLADELEDLGVVGLRRSELVDLELLKVWALDDELAHRPILQGVLVTEALDCELLESFLPIDGAPNAVKDRVENLR